MRELRRAARARQMSVAEWVRQALRAARRDEPDRDAAVKIAAIRSAARHAFPTGAVDEMLADIERGYTSRTAQ